MIKIKENNKNAYEFKSLYDSVGWGAYDNEIAKKALDNTGILLDVNNFNLHLIFFVIKLFT